MGSLLYSREVFDIRLNDRLTQTGSIINYWVSYCLSPACFAWESRLVSAEAVNALLSCDGKAVFMMWLALKVRCELGLYCYSSNWGDRDMIHRVNTSLSVLIKYPFIHPFPKHPLNSLINHHKTHLFRLSSAIFHVTILNSVIKCLFFNECIGV